MRNVMIYGIREVGTEHIIYVGATTNLKNRKLTGYGSKIGKRLRKISWEYIVLETVDLARSVATEAHWIGKLRADGHRLLNVSRPGRTKTKEIAPRRSGKNTNPRRQFEIPERAWSLIDKAAENAVESWPEWARGAQTNALGWPAIRIATVSAGTPPLFTAHAQMVIDGEAVEVTSRATTVKEAQQQATVNLLARIAMVPAAEFKEPEPMALPAAKSTAPDSGKHPVSLLMEHSQAVRCPPPTFDFTVKGEAHAPVVTCVGTFLGHTISAVAASKQEAKLAAAKLLLESVSA